MALLVGVLGALGLPGTSGCNDRDALAPLLWYPPQPDLSGERTEWDIARPPPVDFLPPADFSDYDCLFLPTTSVDFGTILVGNQSVPQNIGLINLCDSSTVRVTSLSLTTAPRVVLFERPVLPLLLGPGEGRAVPLYFSPQVRGLVTGTFQINSDDRRHPRLEVSLRGTGG